MKRRFFLQAASAGIATFVLNPLQLAAQEAVKTARKLKNWAGNLVYSSTKVHEPETLGEVQRLMRAGVLPKALGSRHSFSTIADTTGEHISTKRLNKVVSLDAEAKTITVGAGIRYGELGAYLQKRGWALHNLASLPHISVGGAIATGTHGSGDKNGNLSTAVSALKLVTASGEVHWLSREKDGERFNAAVVGLGALGVIVEVTLDIQPSFEVQQFVYEQLPLEQLYANFDAIMSGAYSTSLFTDFQNPSVNSVWRKMRVEDGKKHTAPQQWHGAKAAPVDRHPVTRLSAQPCTPQMGVAGSWLDRLPHFRMEFTPSVGNELQTELFVPREHAVDAYKAIYALRDALKDVLIISEVRTMSADKLWMSPAYGRETVSFHFTWTDDGEGVAKVLPLLAKALTPYKVRAHWGKLFPFDAKYFASVYPKMDAFVALCKELDPEGRLRNEYLRKNVFGA